MKNRPKMGPKIDHFSDRLGDGCRLRFGADLGTVLGPMLGRFSDPKSKKKHVEKNTNKMIGKKSRNGFQATHPGPLRSPKETES